MRGLNRVYLILLLVIIATSVFEMAGALSTADYKIEYAKFNDVGIKTSPIEEFQPIRLSAHSNELLHILVKPNGYLISAVIELRIGASSSLFYKFGERVKPVRCKAAEDKGELVCSIPVKFNAKADSRVVLFADKKDVEVRHLDIKEYQAKRASQLSGMVVFYFFMALALFGFLFPLLQDRMVKIALISVTAVCLSFLSLSVFLMVSGFLLLFFCLLKLILRDRGSKSRYFVIAFSGLISLLVFIKFLAPFASVLFQNPGALPLAIPLGFSYFVIKIVDLSIDCYKGALSELGFIDYLCYLLFPCTLPAGPIKTFKQYLSFRIKSYTSVHYASGVARTFFGIIKKLLADVYILPIINAKMLLFVEMDGGGSAQQSILVFQMLLLNFIYIYLDFTAYCDMAIGSARAMGFNVPENFKWPLVRTSVSEYWQHWHMTLSNWARKNVFMNVILSTRSLFLATFSTMLCIGLWHKPSFGWFSWACHHTVIMRIEDYVKRNRLLSQYTENLPDIFGKLFAAISVFYVWFLVAMGQSFIIFSDFSLSFQAYRSMLEAPYFLILGLF